MTANQLRGECAIRIAGEEVIVRPTFAALVSAEVELGSLVGLIERASEGRMTLSEIAALFDHLTSDRPTSIARGAIGDTLVAMGLSKVTPLLRIVFAQVLKGTAG